MPQSASKKTVYKSDKRPTRQKSTGRRKRRKRRRKNFSLLLIILLVFARSVFVLPRLPLFGRHIAKAGENALRIKKDKYTVTVEDPDSLLSDEWKTVLEDYGEIYAKLLTELSVGDVRSLYRSPDSDEAYINLAAFETLSYVRNLSDIDLKEQYCDITYTVTAAQYGNSSVTVTLKEDNVQKFARLKEPSLSRGLLHVMTLVTEDGRRKIKEHYHEEDFYLLAMQIYEDSPLSSPAERKEWTMKTLKEDASGSMSLNREARSTVYYPPQGYSYDRNRAVGYAEKYWNERNYRRGYEAFDEYGGNCQNFCSQCIFAGNVAMDYRGESGAQWKWFGPGVNENPTQSGRSYSWTGVDAFYNYASAGYSKDLSCDADVPLSRMEKADILQLGAYGEWRHSVFVTDILHNRDGSVKDIVIASNTADRWNYPVSAYVYSAVRAIHINGKAQ